MQIVIERVKLLFLTVSWVCLRFVNVLFPDRTHLLFLTFLSQCCTVIDFNEKDMGIYLPEKEIYLSLLRVDKSLCLPNLKPITVFALL